ncbi:MAG: hypothetical protein WCE69_09895 [Aestuariivirga sp.]
MTRPSRLLERFIETFPIWIGLFLSDQMIGGGSSMRERQDSKIDKRKTNPEVSSAKDDGEDIQGKPEQKKYWGVFNKRGSGIMNKIASFLSGLMGF